MAAMFSENAQKVLSFLQDHVGENLTAQEIASENGIENRSITGVLNGLQRKGLLIRKEAKVEVDGKEKVVKYILLTDEGVAADPTAQKPAKE